MADDDGDDVLTLLLFLLLATMLLYGESTKDCDVADDDGSVGVVYGDDDAVDAVDNGDDTLLAAPLPQPLPAVVERLLLLATGVSSARAACC